MKLIPEEDEIEDMNKSIVNTMNEESNVGLVTEPEENIKDTDIDASGKLIKLLVTKKKTITEDKDDQDIVIEALRNIQVMVEYWI